jgi:hypothetical protein
MGFRLRYSHSKSKIFLPPVSVRDGRSSGGPALKNNNSTNCCLPTLAGLKEEKRHCHCVWQHRKPMFSRQCALSKMKKCAFRGVAAHDVWHPSETMKSPRLVWLSIADPELQHRWMWTEDPPKLALKADMKIF